MESKKYKEVSKRKVKNRKEKKEEKHVKICPKCNSLNIKSDLTLAFLGETSTMTCSDCGYTNTFFPEVEVSKVREFIKKKKE